MGADANARQVLLSIDAAGGGHGSVEDVVHRAQGQRDPEHVAEHGLNAAQGAMAVQRQGEDELPQQAFGDGKIKEHVVIGRGGGGGGEGSFDGFLSLVRLLVDELAADLKLLGQSGDRLRTRQRLHG